MREEKLKKKKMEKEDREQEVAQVNRLKDEMAQEREIYLEKRKQEKEYLKIMLDENQKR